MPQEPKPSPNSPAHEEPKPRLRKPSEPGQGIQPGETKTIEVPGAKGAPGRGNVTESTT